MNFPEDLIKVLNFTWLRFLGERLWQHKVIAAAFIVFLGFGIVCLQVRTSFISKLAQQAKDFKSLPTISFPVSTPSIAPTSEDSPSPDDNSVLGVSAIGGWTAPTPVPDSELTPPVPTPLPTPTPAPTQPSVTSSATSCVGKPNADNSEVYVASRTSVVNNAVTTTVNLIDCSNSLTSNDHLNITLVSGDPNATIEGTKIGSGYGGQAQNGKYSFSLNSQTAGTVTLKIQDTDQNFEVTTPGYHQPTVNFTSILTSGNPNCTTGPGVPNSYYSDVYINPSSVTVGSSSTFSVVVRDCFENTVSSSDTLTISQTSNDSSATINGQTPSVSLQTNQGKASLTVTSQNPGTDTFTITDTTQSFSVTDSNNHNPSVTFTSSSGPTPTPTSTPTSTPTTTTPTPTPEATPISTPQATTSPTPTPTSNPSPSP